MSIASVMPSSPLILWCPLLLLPSIFPNIPVSLTHLILQRLWEAGAIEGQPCKTTIFKCQVKEDRKRRKRRHRVKKRKGYPGSQGEKKERDKLCYWEMNQEEGEVSSLFCTFLAVLGRHCSTWAFSSCCESGAVLWLWCAGFSLWWLLLLWSTGSWAQASVVAACELSCSAPCGIFLDLVSNPCPLHWQMDSLTGPWEKSRSVFFVNGDDEEKAE